MTDALFYTTHSSPIGILLLVASARGMRWLRLVESDDVGAALTEAGAADAVRLDSYFDSTKHALEAYLTKGAALQVPVDLAGGTPLQRAVWLALSRIPYGHTTSYSGLAERVGFPRAIRAIASACGANPVPLAIPCHRVVAKDGSLGGFSLGGVEVKEKLLALEQGEAAEVAA